MAVCSSFWYEKFHIIHHLLTNSEKKADAVPPEYHLDLPLQGDNENVMGIGKECKLKGLHAHLFPFIIVIGLLN